ncbi:MAG: MoxR family ATPase [Leptospiraceae bacterium]|nr:MoxR family ATPase [Leptospiraceae bacterium]MDW7976040.1 MoxR family ATPase [Leptospiraceae bacterium]
MKRISYIISSELQEAIRVAEITGRPLLLRGEPGTGKTLLAHAIAQQKNMPLFEWHVKSYSKALDGLYTYDALARLNDSRFSENQEKVKNIENYIELGALGKAFVSDVPAVVLIDEIDKADIEFPNDLLLELDQMEFVIVETGRKIKAKHRPFTIITSNNEKELPDAFLRRCVFHYIAFPSPEFMKEIVYAHFPNIDQVLLQKAIEIFYRIRSQPDLKKKPSTSEFLDWLQVLMVEAHRFDGKIPFIGALIKNEEDLKLLSYKF